MVTNIQHKVCVLDGTKVTYTSWVKLFMLHAKGYKVLHHIDGTDPLADTDPEYASWAKIDSIVLQWIYGTLSNDLLVRVLETDTTARDAWVRLQGVFLNNKGSRAATLKHAFTNHKLSACSSLDEYCTKLKEIDEQLKDVYQPVPEFRVVLQLARDLPPEYSVTATLIHQQSPTWDIARDMIECEAQQLAALETA
ncbi:uncharacterized protein LOC110876006 [Helianthus annuus]|uniref:uncharacterized protein LOC110876006 n=1 Tax=Helianthus annuus TaxID=4232 RepID=UPI000B8FE443|nr:uncharacterized protein LOC110876006 [Helianthus annuus]